jgi:short-subunit dehydrogenase
MDRLEATKQEVEDLGGEALILQADVANADAIDEAAQQVEDTYGPIDIWVNNAMTSVFGEFTEITPEEYKRVTDVVYHGQMHGMQAALKRMLPRDRGSIVLVGSALAYRGIPLQSAYCGAKHAIQGMFESVRSELKHNDSNVRLSTVHLPAMNTPQFEWVRTKMPRKAQPVPPIFQPEVAADAIVWAAHNDRREVYVGYSTVQVIFGNKVAPELGDWYLAKTGYDSQQRDEPEDQDRPDNLWEPVPSPFSARGAFDDQARSSSPQLWATKHKTWLAAAGALAAGIIGGALWNGSS